MSALDRDSKQSACAERCVQYVHMVCVSTSVHQLLILHVPVLQTWVANDKVSLLEHCPITTYHFQRPNDKMNSPKPLSAEHCC